MADLPLAGGRKRLSLCELCGPLCLCLSNCPGNPSPERHRGLREGHGVGSLRRLLEPDNLAFKQSSPLVTCHSLRQSFLTPGPAHDRTDKSNSRARLVAIVSFLPSPFRPDKDRNP